MDEPAQWVIDTSAYTHLCRAGHEEIIGRLAPGGWVVVPDAVNLEIEAGRAGYPGIPAVADVDWAQVTVLTDNEVWTQLEVKAHMGGRKDQHIGECAVIACAKHRGLIAILDERAAIEQADRLEVRHHDTLWMVIEAYKTLFDRDREHTARVVDDLIGTGMYLPITSGRSLLAWAYKQGLLP